MERLSLHRALAELKLIDKKLDKHFEQSKFIGCHFKGSAIIETNKTAEAFEQDAKAAYQSYKDLIERKIKIKSGILKANSVATIVLDGKTLTIAEAIAMKENVGFYEKMIMTLRMQLANVLRRKEQGREQIDRTVNQIAVAMFGKDAVNAPANQIAEIRTQAELQNGVNIVDPISVEKQIEEISATRDAITSKLDYLLSEVNATTFIEV